MPAPSSSLPPKVPTKPADRSYLATGLLLATVLGIGAAAGLGIFAFGYAQGTSYLVDSPKACANCHVMEEHFSAWIKSSHGKFATCNDCHAPHDGVIEKYYCKGRNGFFHSLAFTTGNYPENLVITDYNRGITERACRHCHSEIVHTIDVESSNEPIACIRCHDNVGHGP